MKKERLVLIFCREIRYGSLILLSIMENEIIQSLSEELFIDKKRIEDILGALLKGDKKQIILQAHQEPVKLSSQKK